MNAIKRLRTMAVSLGRVLRGSDARGAALIVVLMMVAIFLAMVSALLVQSEGEHVLAVNEQDHLKALSHAEAGQAWVEERLFTAAETAGFNTFSDVLNGPNNGSATDDYLPGLRDLTLTATSQFTNANEGTTSAIVTRDFLGTGSKTWEVIRVPDGTNTRAHIYVRLDDNFDEDPDLHTSNNPLVDDDKRIRATIVSEYPVFVGGGGAEVTNDFAKRGRAVRMLTTTFGPPGLTPAMVSNGDLDIPGNPTSCGACGSVHSNKNISIAGSPNICGDATASGTYTVGGSPTIGGRLGASFPLLPVPKISPYDKLMVPSIQVFNTTALPVPAELQCAAPTAADPGNSKYFALVADNDKGKVFKAYWSFTNSRWNWKMIDDLSNGTDTKLDNCGRVVSGEVAADPFAGAAVTDKPGDAAGTADEFYGFKGASTESTDSCTPSCGSLGADASMCVMGNNDFTDNAYFNTAEASVATIAGSGCPALPGGKNPDGVFDWTPTVEVTNGNWTHGNSYVFSPMYNAVVFVYGSAIISGSVGSASGVYCNAAGCGAAGSVPNDVWSVSIIAYSNIEVSGNPSYAPANPLAGYAFLLVAGRDVKINGNPGATNACGSGCSTTSPPGIDALAGVIAAHEQVSVSGNPNILGFIVAENAKDCSTTTDGQGRGASEINGNPSIFYDCNNPPNPWLPRIEKLSWQEIE